MSSCAASFSMCCRAASIRSVTSACGIPRNAKTARGCGRCSNSRHHRSSTNRWKASLRRSNPPGAQPMPPIARIHNLRWLLRGRSTEGDRHRAEGQEEVCLDRRLGLPGLAGGDPTKPLVTDPTKQCFECHQPKKNKDYVHSTTSCERSMDWLVRSSRTCGLCSGDLSAAVTSLYEVVSDPPLWVNC